MYGTGNPAVNPDGTVVGASYQTPNDTDLNGTFDFLQFGGVPNITSQPMNVATCPGCETVLTVVSDGDIYQWQTFSDGSWVDLSDTGIYSGTNTTTLVITNPTPQENNGRYRVTVSNSNFVCGNDLSDEVTLTIRVNTVITNRRITYRVNKN